MSAARGRRRDRVARRVRARLLTPAGRRRRSTANGIRWEGTTAAQAFLAAVRPREAAVRLCFRPLRRFPSGPAGRTPPQLWRVAEFRANAPAVPSPFPSSWSGCEVESAMPGARSAARSSIHTRISDTVSLRLVLVSTGSYWGWRSSPRGRPDRRFPLSRDGIRIWRSDRPAMLAALGAPGATDRPRDRPLGGRLAWLRPRATGSSIARPTFNRPCGRG
jgi:hypothetical protein